jgi:UDP-glucose:(heptosyl)LPS alpha-1,3-glucosyltransferase
MRLLVIARAFTFHGGVERATAGLLHALVEHGIDVELLSLPGQGPVAGVRVRTLAMPPLPAAVRALALAALAGRVVRRGRWDVVQSHERTLCQHVYRAGEGCHRGYLATRRRGGRGLHHRVALALEQRVFARTPRIVAIAEAGRREIAALYGVEPDRLSVVYNGVDLERFHPRNRAALGKAARAEAGIGDADWTALFVGSGFERKGLPVAIRAFAALGDRSARLVVIGKGDAAPYRALAAGLGVGEQLVWLGPRPDVERWYGAADACVLPALYEPFGNVHLEALASGVPVVASVRAGGREALTHPLAGSAVDPADPDAVLAALVAVRERQAGRADEARAAARACAEPFTFAAQVAGFVRVYANFP